MILPWSKDHRHEFKYDPKQLVIQPHTCGYKVCLCWVEVCECGERRERKAGTGWRPRVR